MNIAPELLELLKTLRKQGVTDRRVLRAMAAVPREHFMPAEVRERAYENRALTIGHQQTISQPYIVGLMTQALALSGVERVLEIGTGSGYQAAILRRLAAEVFTIERIPALAEQAVARFAELGIAGIHTRLGDGSLGWPAEAPFDRIIVTAAARDIPTPLLSQLADGGVLVAPIGGPDSQHLVRVVRRGEQWNSETLCSCRFVPLLEGVADSEADET